MNSNIPVESFDCVMSFGLLEHFENLQPRMPELNYNTQNSFHKAAALVKIWGEATLPNGRTVEDVLTIDGISLWSVISPMLALGHIARVLQSQPRHQGNLRDYCGRLAKKAKRLALDAVIPMVANRKDCDGWQHHPTFLFLGFSHYIYRETLQPVAAGLANRSDCAVIILDDVLPMQSRKIRHDGLMFQSLWQHWDDDVAQTERKMRKALKETTAQLAAPSGLPRIVASSGLDWKNFHYVFAWLFGSYFPRLVTQAAIALHIIERHRPALLISPDVNDSRTRIFCLAGKLSGIRTLEIQFAFHGIDSIEWRFFIADHLAVPGKTSEEIMISHGIPRERITVTGSPCYDSTLSCAPEQVRTIRFNFGMPDGKVMVLFASQPNDYNVFSTPDIRREMIRALFQAASMLDGIVVVVKPHPMEDHKELKRIAGSMRNIIFAENMIDIRDLIKAADAFVTFFSTTTFHALVLNKPTMNLAFAGAYGNNLFEHCGATFVARTADDIERILRLIKSDQISEFLDNFAPARKRFLRQWFYKLDGRAGEAIGKLALKMASSAPNASVL